MTQPAAKSEIDIPSIEFIEKLTYYLKRYDYVSIKKLFDGSNLSKEQFVWLKELVEDDDHTSKKLIESYMKQIQDPEKKKKDLLQKMKEVSQTVEQYEADLANCSRILAKATQDRDAAVIRLQIVKKEEVG